MAERIAHFKPGDLWVAKATFTVGGVPTDPTTLIVKYQGPDGTETTLAGSPFNPAVLNTNSTPVAKLSTGVFQLNPGIALTTTGYWFLRYQGTGAATATDDQQAIVDPSEFTSDAGIATRALVTLAETKDWLNITQEDTSEDLDIVRLINDISERVMTEAGREFKVSGTNPQTRTFPVDELAAYRRKIMIGDLAAAPTTVVLQDIDWTTTLETLSAGQYMAQPLVRQTWQPIRWLELHWTVRALYGGMRVLVTGTWGFPSVPGNIRQAVLDAVAAARDRHVESYSADLSAPTGPGTTNVLVAPASTQLIALPPRVQAVVESYRDPVVA